MAELFRWSARTNLIAAESTGEIIFRHVLDSLAPLRFLPQEHVSADVGSGAGFPGLPLAILHEGPMRLIESRRRRASFLRHVVRDLALSHVEVFEGRAEDFSEPLGAALSRGVRPEVTIALGARLLPPGGLVLLLEKQGAPRIEDERLLHREPRPYSLPGSFDHQVTILERCST